MRRARCTQLTAWCPPARASPSERAGLPPVHGLGRWFVGLAGQHCYLIYRRGQTRVRGCVCDLGRLLFASLAGRVALAGPPARARPRGQMGGCSCDCASLCIMVVPPTRLALTTGCPDHCAPRRLHDEKETTVYKRAMEVRRPCGACMCDCLCRMGFT